MATGRVPWAIMSFKCVCVQPAFQVGFRGSKRPPKMALESLDFVEFLELGLGVYNSNWSKLMVFLGVPKVDGFLPTLLAWLFCSFTLYLNT